jgi:hypothetical protein
MAKITIRDNSIWLSHIEGDAPLRSRLERLKPGQAIDLEVAGVVGRWERMKPGRDGRPTPGIKPIEAMRDVWKKMQARRGQLVELREVQTADSYLAALSRTLSEWDSPEDEEAYRDL